MFATVNALLSERRLLLKAGTIVDATIIAAPSSTKNATKTRDPEMKQTRKGNQWYFGMKLHIGVDSKTGLAHSAVVTAANVHDKHPLPQLMHGAAKELYDQPHVASIKPDRGQPTVLAKPAIRVIPVIGRRASFPYMPASVAKAAS
jgi:IS5 family transposase